MAAKSLQSLGMFGVILSVLLLAGCSGKQSPTAPTVTAQPIPTIPTRPANPNVPTFVVSGQSNACPLGNYLTLIGPTRMACSGGTAIRAWGATPPPAFPGDWHWVWPDLYAVLTYAPTPDVFVWFQGESDATDALIPDYGAALTDLLKRVRTATKPDLIIVIVGLEDYTADRPHWDAIRGAQAQVAAADPRALYVSTMDIPTCQPVCQHLSDVGYSTLAVRILDTIRPLFFR